MMKFTGKLKEPIIDYITGRLTILFEPCEDFRQTYEELKGCEKLSLEIKRYRRKRSLDSNSYYWLLTTKLAKVTGLSNSECHNMMLRGYGQPEIFEGKCVYLTIPDTEEAEKRVNNATDYHLQPTSQVREGNDGIMYRTYKLLRGSHTYNTAEMSRLIDGLISECKHAGIPDREIATPDEQRILKEKYNIKL
mgnify:CR=1 FL=1